MKLKNLIIYLIACVALCGALSAKEPKTNENPDEFPIDKVKEGFEKGKGKLKEVKNKLDDFFKK